MRQATREQIEDRGSLSPSLSLSYSLFSLSLSLSPSLSLLHSTLRPSLWRLCGTAATDDVEHLIRDVPLACILGEMKHIIELEGVALVLQQHLSVYNDQHTTAEGWLAVDDVGLELRLGEAEVSEADEDVSSTLYLLRLPGEQGLRAVDTSQLVALTGEECIVVLCEASTDLLKACHQYLTYLCTYVRGLCGWVGGG